MEEENKTYCKQTFIPEVDNSEEECDKCGFISANCVKMPEDIEALGITENENLFSVITKLVQKIAELEARIPEEE